MIFVSFTVVLESDDLMSDCFDVCMASSRPSTPQRQRGTGSRPRAAATGRSCDRPRDGTEVQTRMDVRGWGATAVSHMEKHDWN